MFFSSRIRTTNRSRASASQGAARYRQSAAGNRQSAARPSKDAVRSPAVGIGALAFLCVTASLGLAGCFAPEDEQISCDDIPPPDQVSYALLEREVTQGCGFSNCHGSEVAEKGLRLDTSARVFEALSNRAGPIYSQLASGEMPKAGDNGDLPLGEPWSETQLANFRGWYCYGGFPDD